MKQVSGISAKITGGNSSSKLSATKHRGQAGGEETRGCHFRGASRPLSRLSRGGFNFKSKVSEMQRSKILGPAAATRNKGSSPESEGTLSQLLSRSSSSDFEPSKVCPHPVVRPARSGRPDPGGPGPAKQTRNHWHEPRSPSRAGGATGTSGSHQQTQLLL
jgi:hypothetical protein